MNSSSKNTRPKKKVSGMRVLRWLILFGMTLMACIIVINTLQADWYHALRWLSDFCIWGVMLNVVIAQERERESLKKKDDAIQENTSQDED